MHRVISQMITNRMSGSIGHHNFCCTFVLLPMVCGSVIGSMDVVATLKTTTLSLRDFSLTAHGFLLTFIPCLYFNFKARILRSVQGHVILQTISDATP